MTPVDPHKGISIIGYDLRKNEKNLQKSGINVQHIKTKCKLSPRRWGTGNDTHIDNLHSYASTFTKQTLDTAVHSSCSSFNRFVKIDNCFDLDDSNWQSH